MTSGSDKRPSVFPSCFNFIIFHIKGEFSTGKLRVVADCILRRWSYFLPSITLQEHCHSFMKGCSHCVSFMAALTDTVWLISVTSEIVTKMPGTSACSVRMLTPGNSPPCCKEAQAAHGEVPRSLTLHLPEFSARSHVSEPSWKLIGQSPAALPPQQCTEQGGAVPWTLPKYHNCEQNKWLLWF